MTRLHRKRLACTALFLLSLLIQHSPAQAEARTFTVLVQGSAPLMDTGIMVNAGDKISISATGTIFVSATDPGKTPAGATCPPPMPGLTFAVNGLPCWSLFGRIGAAGPPFAVGTSMSLTAATAGSLVL